MSLDGAFLSRVKLEIEQIAIGSRIEKISQPSREVLIFTMHRRGGGCKLLLCAAPAGPRIHFTKEAPENPQTPPMFCMLMRKHMSGAKLIAVRQPGLDRILSLDFEAVNELGDLVNITVVMEIMGRHSNIIAVGPDGRILDSIKRVGLETSSVRQVLPGMKYESPPPQDKLCLTDAMPADVVGLVKKGRDIELSKALMDVMQGVSPLLCREIAHYATGGIETIRSDITGAQFDRLAFYLSGLRETLIEGACTPTMAIDPETGAPKDFSFVPIRQYGVAMLTKEYESCSDLLDNFYTDRDRMERVHQRSGDLLKLLANATDRITRKLAAQREELLACAKRDELKIKGDLISANLYAIQKGDKRAVVQNFYDPDGGEIEIPLDEMLTPPQNAQRYYALYRKADTAEKMLVKLIDEGNTELAYLDSVFDALTRACGESDLDAIRRELAVGGYLRRGSTAKKQKEQKLAPLRYRSADGLTILVGRNNVQNDQLTLKEAANTDIWLHTQKIPGSHTIISAKGGKVPDSTIEQAAILAAYHSKARASAKVPVDFSLVKHVKKPVGAKPGMVIYDNFQTVVVTPDEYLVKSLQEK